MEDSKNTTQPGLFERGGKLGFLHSSVDAFDTFLRVPGTVTSKGAHVRDAVDLKRIMIIVVVALIPAALFGMWNVGYQHGLATGQSFGLFQNFWYGFLKVLPLYLVAYIVGLGIEFASAQIRNEEVNEGYLVSGMLIPLIVPVDVPLWTLAIAVAFAVLFGKEVFGGTGMNFLNPALLCRAFLFFAYPASISGTNCWVPVDGFSGATPLAQWAQGGEAALKDAAGNAINWVDAFMGNIPGSIGEGSTIMILVGAAIILATGVASFRIMVGILVGAFLTATLFNAIGSTTNEMFNMPFEWHAVLGGFAFGTVFMATDPVSSSFTNKGKWAFGVLIGVMVILIRTVNPAYPEGMMLAILFANCWAPLFDYLATQRNIKRRLARVKA